MTASAFNLCVSSHTQTSTETLTAAQYRAPCVNTLVSDHDLVYCRVTKANVCLRQQTSHYSIFKRSCCSYLQNTSIACFLLQAGQWQVCVDAVQAYNAQAESAWFWQSRAHLNLARETLTKLMDSACAAKDPDRGWWLLKEHQVCVHLSVKTNIFIHVYCLSALATHLLLCL